DSGEVNEYVREVAGAEFTAKDFRTWAGTVLAARALASVDHVENERIAKRNVTTAVEQVAARLGNTRAVCRRCYIHPAIVDAYIDGELSRALRERGRRDDRDRVLPADEACVLRFLERRLAVSTNRPTPDRRSGVARAARARLPRSRRRGPPRRRAAA